MTEEYSPQRQVLALAGVFVFAFALRMLVFLAASDSVFSNYLLSDAEWHDMWAWEWARGTWEQTRAFFRAPLYPWLLSKLYLAAGHEPSFARLVQAGCGALSAAALAGAAGSLGGRRAFWAAGFITAVYGTLIYFEGEILIPTLLVTLLSCGLWAATAARSAAGFALAGAVLGLAAAARPNVLVLGLPLLVLIRRSEFRFNRMAAAGGALVLFLTPALLVTLQNYRAERVWVPVASQGGINLYAGNHPGADGRSVRIPELEQALNWGEFVEQSEEVASESAGRALNSEEVSAWWASRAREWVQENPGAWLRVTLKKFYYLINGYEIPNNRDLYLHRPWPLIPLLWTSPVLAFPWGLVFPLAVLGAAGFRGATRARSRIDFLVLWFAVYGLSLVPFFICARFRMGLVPPMIVAAALVFSLPRYSKRTLAAALAALVLANTGFLQVRATDTAHELAREGALWLKAGRYSQGIAVLEDAVASDGSRAPAWLLLADALYETGEYRKSASAFEQYVALRPGDAGARFTLGTAYLELLEYGEAAVHLETAVALRPGDIAAWTNLGAAYQGLGREAEAEQAYQEAAAFSESAETAFVRLGELYLMQDRNAEAVDVLKRGVRGSPDDFLLRFRLAEAYAQIGDFQTALGEIERALAIAPGNPDALRVQEWLQSRQ